MLACGGFNLWGEMISQEMPKKNIDTYTMIATATDFPNHSLAENIGLLRVSFIPTKLKIAEATLLE